MEYQIHLFGTQSRIWTFLPMTHIWVAHFGMMSWILAQHYRHPRIIVKWTQKQDPSGMQGCCALFCFEYEFVYPACAKGGTGKKWEIPLILYSCNMISFVMRVQTRASLWKYDHCRQSIRFRHAVHRCILFLRHLCLFQINPRFKRIFIFINQVLLRCTSRHRLVVVA